MPLNEADTRAKEARPGTNVFVENFNRAVLDEFFRKFFREKFYFSVEEYISPRGQDRAKIRYRFPLTP